MTGSISRRYARALLGIARDENAIASFGEALDRLGKALREDPSILETLSSDTYLLEERKKALEEISTRFNFSPHLRSFLLLLADKGRLNLLPQILLEFGRLCDEDLSVVRVTVTTPQAAEAGILERIEKTLSRKLKKKVIVFGTVKPEILGGAILKLGETVYDGSIRRSLEGLRRTMMEE